MVTEDSDARFTVRLPDMNNKSLDELSKRRQVSRNALIVEAVRDLLQKDFLQRFPIHTYAEGLAELERQEREPARDLTRRKENES